MIIINKMEINIKRFEKETAIKEENTGHYACTREAIRGAKKAIEKDVDVMENYPNVKDLMKNTEWKNGWDNACKEIKQLLKEI